MSSEERHGERRSDHLDILETLCKLTEGQKHIKEGLERIEDKTNAHSTRIQKIEKRLSWMQGIGAGIISLLGFLGHFF